MDMNWTPSAARSVSMRVSSAGLSSLASNVGAPRRVPSPRDPGASAPRQAAALLKSARPCPHPNSKHVAVKTETSSWDLSPLRGLRSIRDLDASCLLSAFPLQDENQPEPSPLDLSPYRKGVLHSATLLECSRPNLAGEPPETSPSASQSCNDPRTVRCAASDCPPLLPVYNSLPQDALIRNYLFCDWDEMVENQISKDKDINGQCHRSLGSP